MEKYLLCGELSSSGSRGQEEKEEDGLDGAGGSSNSLEGGGKMKVYKGRKRGTVEFCGIWKHNKAVKELVATGVSPGSGPAGLC